MSAEKFEVVIPETNGALGDENASESSLGDISAITVGYGVIDSDGTDPQAIDESLVRVVGAIKTNEIDPNDSLEIRDASSDSKDGINTNQLHSVDIMSESAAVLDERKPSQAGLMSQFGFQKTKKAAVLASEETDAEPQAGCCTLM